MKTSKTLLCLLTLTLWVPAAGAQEPLFSDSIQGLSHYLGGGVVLRSKDSPTSPGHWTSARPDGHAPIGVMGDHTHAAGEWMFSIRAMQMHMDGMQNDGNSLSSAEVLAQGFLVTPTEMDTNMIMFGGMYAVTDTWTLMAMVPYLSREMEHVTGMGGQFTTESEGLGDLRVAGLYKVADTDNQRVHLNLGLSLPTGSIDETDDTPAMANARLPYPMQLGTGTFDLLPGLTYLGQDGDWSWGAQGTVRLHLGTNDEGYKHGTRLESTGWIARRFGDLSTSLRLNVLSWENFTGQDDNLNPAVVPTADPDLRGGDRVDLLFGLNWYASQPRLAGHRLAVEFGLPIAQNLDGPSLETDWIATVGWQYSL